MGRRFNCTPCVETSLDAADTSVCATDTLEVMASYPPLCAPQRLLLGPGPSMVAPRVYAALGQPVVGHLDPFFLKVMEEIRQLLKLVFSTANEFNIAVSGT